MAERLEGSVALVTGASSGIGEATARALAAQGSKVALVARRADRIEKLAQEIASNGHTALAIEADVTDQEQAISAVERTVGDFGRLDIVVNNAGVMLLGPIHGAPTEEWDRMIDVNVKGLLYVTRAALPAMAERGSGHVINIGSTAGNWPYPGGNVYGGTKAFLKQFSLNLRADLLGTGVRVTNLEPGLAETEFSLVRYKGDAGRASDVYKNIEPLVATDIAEAAFWATSQPAHVNITRIEMMCTAQANGPLALHRGADGHAGRRRSGK